MSHKRQEIKQFFSDSLAGKTIAGGQILTHRPSNVWETKAPFIFLAVPKEVSEKHTVSPVSLKRMAYVSIECVVQGRNFNNNLDLFGKQVEDIINKEGAKLGLAKEIILRESEQQESPDGEIPAGSLTLVYEVTYITNEMPPVVAREFHGANVAAI